MSVDGSGDYTGGTTSAQPSVTPSTGGLSHLPWTQIPAFRPGETDTHEYSRKLEFLAGLWPAENLSLLAPRAAMMCEGSAFQRVMRVDPQKLKTNSLDGVKALVQALGGIWGKTNLEDRFERFERAVYTTVQRGDETHESYLARHDHQFESLLSSGVTMEQLRAYVLLRNSGLAAEDKKKLIIDSAGKLEYSEVVSSLKLLGSKFFQEVHAGSKNPSRSRTYDINAVMEEEVFSTTGGSSSHEEPIFIGESDDSFIESLAEEGDPDALICQQFEEAILDVLQNDTETASCYLTYAEARKRLTDRNRNRGFWSPGSGPSNAKGFKGRGKGKFTNRARKPLAARILESECRRCGQKGHWKAECPLRFANSNASASGQPKENATFTTMTISPDVNDMDHNDMIPMSEMNVTQIPEKLLPFSDSQMCNMTVGYNRTPVNLKAQFAALSRRLKPLIKSQLMPVRSPQPVPKTTETGSPDDRCPEVVFFASHGSFGIVDLGASQSVIGQRQLADVLKAFKPEIRALIRETSCNTVFRFGNSSTVHCQKAVLIPVGKWYVKLCIVPSDTPFLLSNNMFRTLGAQIDTASDRVFLPGLNLSMNLTLTEKKLYLLDFGQLVNLSFQNGQERVKPGVSNIMLTAVQNSCAEEPQTAVVHRDTEPSSCLTGSPSPPYVPECQGTSATVPAIPVTLDPCVTLSNASLVRRDQQGREPCQQVPKGDGGASEVTRGAGFHEDEVGRSGTKCDHVWGGKEGTVLRDCCDGRSELCGMVHDQICPQPEVPTSEVHPLHQDVCGAGRDAAGHHCPQESSSPKGSHAHDGASPRRGHSDRCVRRRDVLVGHHRGATPTDQPDGEQPEPKDLQPRISPGTDCRTTPGTDSSSEGRRNSVDPNGISPSVPGDAADGMSSEVQLEDCIDLEFFQDCLLSDQMTDNQIRHEMWSYWCQRFNISNPQQIRRHFAQPGIDILEIYCSQDSQLTSQCLGRGLSAGRFSRKHGDLNTVSGRHALYDLLWQLRPKHIWVAPTCKPWCCWNRLNAAKSETLARQIQQDRRNENVHLLLCDALLDLQLWRSPECHFHLEQPQGSELVHQREMHRVMQHTFRAICDMCTAGRLQHPMTGNALRKRTQILTTSNIMYHALSKLTCDGSHSHETIQGSCKLSNQNRIPLTQYTELYTATFGRKLSRIVQCSIQAKEKQCVPCQNEDSDLHAVICAVRNEEFPTSLDSPANKRRRLGTKTKAIDAAESNQSVPSLDELENMLKLVESQTPRVGKVVFQQGEVFQKVSDLFPDMNAHVIEACRGVDRKRELPIPAPSHMVPYRRTFGRARNNLRPYCDASWENWEKLSKRQIRRAGTPSKLAVTMFASKKKIPDTHDSMASNGNQDPPVRHEAPPPETEMPYKKVRFEEPHIDKTAAETMEFQEEEPLPSEVTCPKIQYDQKSLPTHGPMFRGLPIQLQQMINKVHKNLGHPNVRQLQQALKRNGWSEVIVQAVQDFHCDVCFEKSQPKAQRPAHIHAPREFNDLVVFDGVDWSDGQGNKYTFIHFLDTSTNFQIAVPFFDSLRKNSWIASETPGSDGLEHLVK